MTFLLPALLLEPAVAAPRFLGEPFDVAIATTAWENAAACTGREGRATKEVEIRYRTIPGGYLGVAHTDPDGTLFRIDLNTDPERHREVLVHEVAHAWVSEGPVALVEGAAELLADCIVSRTPGLAPLQYDDGRDLSGLPDLQAWAAPSEKETEPLGAIRTDAYLGAARLMRTAELVVPPGALWPEGGLDWSEFEALLVQAGPRGAPLLEALQGGAEAQRAALRDADLDGVPALAEALGGTRDDTFDTDGDGWWDGAGDRPTGAVAVPLDGSPVCTGRRAGAGGAVEVVAGGNLRGQEPPRVVARPGSHGQGWVPAARKGGWGSATALVQAGASVLVQLDGPPHNATGAPWAVVQGATLKDDPGCRSTRTATVWARDAALVGAVEPVATALDQAIAALSDRFGPLPTRVAVALGGERSTVEGQVVWLSRAEVERAVARGEVAALARLAVSVHHLWQSGEPSWRAGEALALSLE